MRNFKFNKNNMTTLGRVNPGAIIAICEDDTDADNCYVVTSYRARWDIVSTAQFCIQCLNLNTGHIEHFDYTTNVIVYDKMETADKTDAMMYNTSDFICRIELLDGTSAYLASNIPISDEVAGLITGIFYKHSINDILYDTDSILEEICEEASEKYWASKGLTLRKLICERKGLENVINLTFKS